MCYHILATVAEEIILPGLQACLHCKKKNNEAVITQLGTKRTQLKVLNDLKMTPNCLPNVPCLDTSTDSTSSWLSLGWIHGQQAQLSCLGCGGVPV